MDGERVLDRRAAPESVSAAYPMRSLVGPRAPRSYTWRHVQFDQGAQGACTVACAMSEAAARPKPYWGDPVTAKPTSELVSSLNVFMTTTGYDWVRRNDEWPGHDYQGSSLNAACKLGRAMDWWTGWRWSLGAPTDKVRDVVTTLSYYGPVMFASTWRAGMWKADQGGYLRYTGKDEGGHAYLLTAYSVSRQAAWTPNSWGGYGQGWITTSDLTSMFADDAEAAVAVGRKIKAAPWR